MFIGAWPTVLQAQKDGSPGDTALEGNPMEVVKLTPIWLPIGASEKN